MSTLRQLLPALRVWIVLMVLLGLLYPVALLGVGRAMPGRADGSLLEVDGRVVGSALVGQPFEASGQFWSRPSASGYDTQATGGSNLGPNNADLSAEIQARRAALAKANGVAPEAVPADAVTASASGIDPHISPEYAALQVDRVARALGLDRSVVAGLVAEHTSGRVFGFLGDPTVNVVTLNAALEQVSATTTQAQAPAEAATR